MRTCKILLNTVTDVKELVELVSACTYEVGLVSGRYSVNAKSIMGVFSLDLSKPVTHALSQSTTPTGCLSSYRNSRLLKLKHAQAKAKRVSATVNPIIHLWHRVCYPI